MHKETPLFECFIISFSLGLGTTLALANWMVNPHWLTHHSLTWSVLEFLRFTLMRASIPYVLFLTARSLWMLVCRVASGPPVDFTES